MVRGRRDADPEDVRHVADAQFFAVAECVKKSQPRSISEGAQKNKGAFESVLGGQTLAETADKIDLEAGDLTSLGGRSGADGSALDIRMHI